jgi:hypothetical protein
MMGSASYAVQPDLLVQVASEKQTDLKAMEGKRVIGKNRELLGHLGKVDAQAKTAELKTPAGPVVTIPTDVLIEDGNNLAAPSMSRGDVIALIDRPGQKPTISEAGVLPIPR